MTTASHYHIHVSPEAPRASPTMSAGQMANAAKARGKDVTLLTVGDLFPKPTEPELQQWLHLLNDDAKKPENANNPIYKGLRQGEWLHAYSDTTGLPTLRAAAAHTFSRDTGCTASADEIMVGVGGKGALKGALWDAFKPGDLVAMAVPCWPTNFDMFRPGVKIIEVPTKDGLLRAEDVRTVSASYPNLAGIAINAPCNPTGANYKNTEREEFMQAAAATKALIVSDDPYGKLVLDRESYNTQTVLQRGPAEKALFEQGRLAVFRTASKEYGLAGDRVGYVATKNKTMLESLKCYNESWGGGMNVQGQLLAQAAWLYGDAFIERTVETLKAKRKILFEGVNELSTAKMNLPSGTIYGWVDFSGLKGQTVPKEQSETGEAYTINTPADMMRYLVNVAGVCCVPGTPFFAPNSPNAAQDWHVRATFCGPEADLRKAVDKLQQTEKACGFKTNGKAVA